MSKEGQQEKEIQQMVTMGKRNLALIPRVYNWCEHIEIQDQSAGLITEMYQIPTSLAIGCPHASGGYTAANFEWIARDFILENCKDCQFHKKKHSPNFGEKVFVDHAEFLKQEEEAQQLIQAKRSELHQYISELKEDIPQLAIQELSIHNIINQLTLTSSDKRKELAEQLVEASQLNPSFFSTLSIEALSLYFSEDDIGRILLEATANILSVQPIFSDFFWDQFLKSFEKNADASAEILEALYQLKDPEYFHLAIEKLIQTLDFRLGFNHYADERPTHNHACTFLLKVYHQDKDFLIKQFRAGLLSDEKKKRINANYLFQSLLQNEDFEGMFFLNDLIHSLEKPDDRYEESADKCTLNSLSELFKKEPQTVFQSIKDAFLNLSEGARKELIKGYPQFLQEIQGIEDIKVREQLLDHLFSLYERYKKDPELSDQILSILKREAKRDPKIFLTRIEVCLGIFIDVLRSKEIFKWYVDELDKPVEERSTFNPLTGATTLDMISQKNTLEKNIRTLNDLLSPLIARDNNYQLVLEILKSLELPREEKLKGNLISLLREAIKDPEQLALLLPNLYNWMLEINSENIRLEAFDFLNALLKEYDGLITHTLIDLIKVFLKDDNPVIKGSAIRSYRYLARKFPEHIQPEEIQLILNSFSHTYVIIHKNCFEFCYEFYHDLNKEQQASFLLLTMGLHKVYAKDGKQEDFCIHLIDALLMATADNEKAYCNIVKDFLIPHIEKAEYFDRIKFLKKLTFLYKPFDALHPIWIEQTLDFLRKTKKDPYSSMDDREFFFKEFYKLPKNFFSRNLLRIKEFILEKLHSGQYFDVFEFFDILGFFNFHEYLKELSDIFAQEVEAVERNNHFRKVNQEFQKSVALEVAAGHQLIDKQFIKAYNKN